MTVFYLILLSMLSLIVVGRGAYILYKAEDNHIKSATGWAYISVGLSLIYFTLIEN